jgi:hypothetical protein
MFKNREWKNKQIELDGEKKQPEASSPSLTKKKQSSKISLKKAKKYDVDWKDDRVYPNCFQCQRQFTVVRRRHHCRKCGHIFCAKCTSTKINVEGSKNKKRVCFPCASVSLHNITTDPAPVAIKNVAPALPITFGPWECSGCGSDCDADEMVCLCCQTLQPGRTQADVERKKSPESTSETISEEKEMEVGKQEKEKEKSQQSKG